MKTRMKVLMVTPSFLPKRGGVETHVHMICKELLSRSIEVTVFSRREHSTQAEHEIVDGIQVTRYPKRFFLAWIWMLSNTSRLVKHNVVYCHDVAFVDYLPARFFLFWKPVFQTFHGTEGYPIRRRYRMLRKLIEVLSSGCICVGAFISKYYGTNCDAVVYGGASRIEFHPWSEKRRIAWVGRLGSDFPVIEFARMVKILRDRFGIDLIVEIVGDGPLRKALSCFAEQSKLNFVFHGFVEDPAPYVVSVDMVFAPGYLSMIEAMALGRPVLSIHNNAFRQDYLIPMPVSKAAILAPNAEELASAVAELYSDTSRLQMIGRRGFDLVSRMTWGSIAEVYMKLYEKTTGRIEKALVASLVLL